MASQIKKQVFGTLEWAPHNENIISGCSHNCRYCYSKEMSIRFKRKTAENWSTEIVNHHKLEGKARKYDGRVMFPSSHDITPENAELCIRHLNSLLFEGNDLLIVSKPHFDVIQRMCKAFSSYKKSILFRFTIGSNNSDVLKFWEPGAPSFNERLKSLQFAFENDYATSISIEPMLSSVDAITELVETLLPFVTDSVWIGKPNFLARRLKTNGETQKKVFDRAAELDKWCSDSEILRLYNNLKKVKKVKWKESIKKVVGLQVAQEAGLDE